MTDRRGAAVPATLTALGGLLIAVAGLQGWREGLGLASSFGLPPSVYVGGAVAGGVAFVAGLLMLLRPQHRQVLGAVALAAAAASVPLASGGFVVGFLLTAIGGALASARPPPAPRTPPRGTPGRSPPWT